MADDTGVPDGWEVVTPSTAADAPKGGHDLKILGVNIHVPGEEKPRLDSNIATLGGVGIAPEDALMAGQAVRGVVGATKVGGAIAGVKQAIATAAPQVKYEIARSSLRAIGVPPGVAEVLAMGISSYKSGEKTPTPSPADSPHLDLSTRVPAGGLTQQQIGERLAAARAQGMAAPQVEPTYAPRPAPTVVPPTVAQAAGPTPAPSIAEVLTPTSRAQLTAGRQPIITPPPADASYVRGVDARPDVHVTLRPDQTPRVPTPSVAEAAAPSVPLKSQAWATNNIAIQARRLGVKLTDTEIEMLRPAVQAGMDPAEAIASIKKAPGAFDGLPTDEQMKADVNVRNQTGRWHDTSWRPEARKTK